MTPASTLFFLQAGGENFGSILVGRNWGPDFCRKSRPEYFKKFPERGATSDSNRHVAFVVV